MTMNDDSASHELFEKAVALRNAGDDLSALDAFLAFYQRFEGAADPAVRLLLAEALVNIGVMLMRMRESLRAINHFDKVVDEYPEADESVASALSNKINLLMSEGSADEALKTCEDLLSRFGGFTDAWTINVVARALSNQGVILIRQGKLDEACVVFDEFYRRFGSSTDPVILHELVCVLYNKAIGLRDAGKTTDAVAAFSEVVERFADSDSPDSQRFAAMALYNRGINEAKLGDLQASINSAQEIVSRFRTSQDPAIRERMAKALYNRGLILGLSGMINDAALTFANIAGTFRNDSGAVIEGVVAAAHRRALFMAIQEPAGNAANHPFHQSMILEIENAIREAPPEKIEYLNKELERTKEYVKNLVELDADSHKQAASILIKYLNEGAPFGLFLRSFDLEGSLHTGAQGGTPMWASAQPANKNLVEKQIAEMGEIGIPVLAVTNNSPMLSFSTSYLPRLELPNEHWEAAVEELVLAAEIVIVNVSLLTPGVVRELGILLRLNKKARTVVIISKADELVTGLPGVLLGSPVIGPQAYIGCQELESFPLVVYDSSLGVKDQSLEWQRFRLLLDEVKKSCQMNKGMHWDGVVF